jgi:hypothetical protein
MSHTIRVGSLAIEFSPDGSTVKYDHTNVIYSTSVGARIIKELDDLALKASRSDVEYELCRRANIAFQKYMYGHQHELQDLARSLAQMEIQELDDLQDALRRAWDYADKQRAPEELRVEIERLLKGVPDRRK